MKSKTLLFGLIPLPGSQPVREEHLTAHLIVAHHHNSRPWYRRLTKRVIVGYKDPFKM